MSHIEKSEKLFEVIDEFGHQVSTTQQYWDTIMLIKHRELETTIEEVSKVLKNPICDCGKIYKHSRIHCHHVQDLQI